VNRPLFYERLQERRDDLTIHTAKREKVKRTRKGFTLIELLIVVVVVGVLAALIIPNVVTATQKAKQKETMKQIVNIATACSMYVTNTGYAPDAGNQSGPLEAGSNFLSEISPIFIKVCPINDQWGNPYHVYTGTAVASAYGIPAANLGNDEFLIVSLGRDGEVGGNVSFTYQPNNPIPGLYKVSSIEDFKNDLVSLNGAWIHAPSVSVKD